MALFMPFSASVLKDLMVSWDLFIQTTVLLKFNDVKVFVTGKPR